eukprot:jgi/Tetstr1/431627/TSEL_021157.t1
MDLDAKGMELLASYYGEAASSAVIVAADLLKPCGEDWSARQVLEGEGEGEASRIQWEAVESMPEQAERILFNQLDEASGMWTVAIPTARTVMTPHELREVAARYFLLPSPCLAPVVGSQIILPSTEHNPVIVDLYGDALMDLPAPGDAHWRAMPLGNTVPRVELKDLVPDAELSLPAFNVVTRSYDPRRLKSTLLEFKTMRDGSSTLQSPGHGCGSV